MRKPGSPRSTALSSSDIQNTIRRNGEHIRANELDQNEPDESELDVGGPQYDQSREIQGGENSDACWLVSDGFVALNRSVNQRTYPNHRDRDGTQDQVRVLWEDGGLCGKPAEGQQRGEQFALQLFPKSQSGLPATADQGKRFLTAASSIPITTGMAAAQREYFKILDCISSDGGAGRTTPIAIVSGASSFAPALEATT